MKRYLTMALLMILLCGLFLPGAQAAPKHFYQSKQWWVGTGVILAVAALDAQSGAQARRTCPICGDSSILLPRNPTNGSYWAAAGIIAGIFTGMHAATYELVRNESPAWRVLGTWGSVGINSGLEVGLGISSNLKIISDCRAARLVCR